jgi:N-acyl-D-aspartate/D-glutamate deacylase
MAEWLIANGLESTVNLPAYATDDAMILRLLKDPFGLGPVSDAGAHGQMLCGAGENVLLLTDFARDRGDLTVEEAVHVQTGRAARHFGLTDCGEIAVGKRADIAVFKLDEIEMRPKRKVHDVPDGAGGHTWRWTRDPAPMRLTLVGGVPTFADGKSTGARPGGWLSPRGA